jgi:hypothetical protein
MPASKKATAQAGRKQGRASATDETRRDAGVVLPLIHTAMDATLVTEHGGHRILLTVDRTQLELPPVEHLAFYTGLAVMVGVGLVEIPIGIALGVGHALLDLTRRPGLQALGEALEEA